jgi:hypothetical protein
MKGATTNATLVTSNNTVCMTFAIPHPHVSDQCFLKTFLTFKIWNRSFNQVFIICHGTSMNKNVKNSHKLHVFSSMLRKHI